MHLFMLVFLEIILIRKLRLHCEVDSSYNQTILCSMETENSLPYSERPATELYLGLLNHIHTFIPCIFKNNFDFNLLRTH
jgi:hypothetical protein